MGFLTGQLGQTQGGGPGDIGNLRGDTANALSNAGFENLFGFGQSTEELRAPFEQLFAQQNERNFAQAKESAGNLTGSGVGNLIGNASQRASTEQGAFLAQLLEQRRRADQDRFAGLLSSFGTAGVTGPQSFFQPGFLDSLLEGGSSVATGLATGGFFNAGA